MDRCEDMPRQRRWARVLPAFALWALAATAAAAPIQTPADPPDPAAARGAFELGRHHYGRNAYKEAARLMHQAYALDRVPDYLFNAARAEQRGFELDDAERDFVAYLAVDSISAEARRRATTHLAEVRETRAQLARARAQGEDELQREQQRQRDEQERQQRTPTAEPPKDATSPEAPRPKIALQTRPQSEGGRWLAYGTLALGAVGVGVGAVSAFGAASDQGGLDADVAKRDGDGNVTGLSYGEYHRRQVAIYDQRDRAYWIGGAGVAIAGVGAWLLWRDRGPSSAMVLPLRGGAMVALTFGAAVSP